MSRLRALLFKELQQHWLSLVALAVVLLGAWLLLIVSQLTGTKNVTLFTAHGVFVGGFGTLAAIVLGNRLVVAEYYGQTQDQNEVEQTMHRSITVCDGPTVEYGCAGTGLKCPSCCN